MVNETVSFESRSLPADESLPILDGVKIEAFEVLTYQSTIPSAKGYPIGAIDAPLFPVARLTAGKNYWIDLTGTKVGTFTGFVAGKAFKLQVLNVTMGRNPTLPIYTEMQVANVWKAHSVPDTGEALAAKCALASRYRELLRVHRVEPIKSYHSVYPGVLNGSVDLNGYFPALGCDFETQVLKGRIAPPNLYGPDPLNPPSDALLAAAEADLKAGKLPAGTWSYDWDEGEGDAAISAQALARVKNRRAKSPSLQGAITRRYSTEFAPYVDQFFPVVNYYAPGMIFFGLYPSCMSNGNCQNQATIASVAPATAYPAQTLDGPRAGFLAFPIAVYTVGGKAGLYYNSTQRLITAWKADGLYEQGGQGDGTILFPGLKGMKGLTDDIPVASIVLKSWRKASYIVEYLKAAKAAGIVVSNPAPSPAQWSPNEADYEAVRAEVARKLFGLKSG
jgi:hypothetical protein